MKIYRCLEHLNIKLIEAIMQLHCPESVDSEEINCTFLTCQLIHICYNSLIWAFTK